MSAMIAAYLLLIFFFVVVDGSLRKGEAANWIALALIWPIMFFAYYYRIQSEERMLAATFGEQYDPYAARTHRLIPFLYEL